MSPKQIDANGWTYVYIIYTQRVQDYLKNSLCKEPFSSTCDSPGEHDKPLPLHPEGSGSGSYVFGVKRIEES